MSTRTSKVPLNRYLYIGRDEPLEMLIHGKVYNANIVNQRKRSPIKMSYHDGTDLHTVSYKDHHEFEANWVYLSSSER